jgi:hypothetical protein
VLGPHIDLTCDKDGHRDLSTNVLSRQ